MGVAFEGKAAKYLDTLWPNAVHGQWFEFEDASGLHYCQTDHLVLFDHCVLLFESKLTQCNCVDQINGLYRPVVELAFDRPVIATQVCKNLVKDPGPGLVRNPRMLPTFAPSARIWTLHYLGGHSA